MCKCTPEIRTLFCGKPGCEWPQDWGDELGKKFDQGKPRMDLLPFDALEQVAKVLAHGAEKYGVDNWKSVPEAIPRYTAAMLRHYAAMQAGEIRDKDSGLPHVAHLACNALFLVWFNKAGYE